MAHYQPADIEAKWQQKWQQQQVFSTTRDASREKYYVLEMLPYPSGNLHMGHVRNYTIGDTLARFLRARGLNVIHPMGWDAFGLPAENAALKKNIHPGEWTHSNIAHMKQVMQSFGWSYDWDREIATCNADYYGKQQQLFLKLMEKGLAYQKESLVNWDPIDQTVLANEQVVDGKGWRSGAPVERRQMRQWFFKITEYAQELLDELDNLEGWPERVRTMQRHWIGRSEGLTFTFDVTGCDEKLEVYTTRPDTIMGVTFCSVAPEHPLAQQAASNDAEIASFIKECEAMGTAEEIIEKAEKKGLPLPYKAIHPLTGEEVPIYVANYVLASVGSGAVMAVPAHDERDHAFAVKYNLPVKQVIDGGVDEEVWAGDGTLINSGEFNGLDNQTAKQKIIAHFEQKGTGERTINWRLRDWGISRQRYWGCPIPLVHCPSCGIVPVPEDQLPVSLPEDVTFDKPGNPLEHHPTWKQTQCPTCGEAATRETDTMDTFVDSSWYFVRYCCPQADTAIEKADADYWLPVDQYIGGIEHAVLHLLYARFFTKALADNGLLNAREPFKALLCQGMLVGHSYKDEQDNYINPIDIKFEGDKAIHKQTGEQLKVLPVEKISKSKNNGIAPETMLEKYGADTLRLFMLFTAPPERDLEWSDQGVEGVWRFLNRVWALAEKAQSVQAVPLALSELADKNHQNVKRAIHKTIRKVTADIEKFHYNTMVAACMELANTLGGLKSEGEDGALLREGVETLLRLLNPAAPHITEELWASLGHSTMLALSDWPTFDKQAVTDDEITLVVQINGKLRERLLVPADISKEDAEKQALEAVEPHLGGLTVRKTVVVPGRLVNVVAN